MISINQKEANALRKNVPNVHIVRTMKQKSKRKHYFCEESRQALAFLESMRRGSQADKKAGINDGYNKKA